MATCDNQGRPHQNAASSEYLHSPTARMPVTHDTVEVRWFATGVLPEWAVEWFTESGTKAMREVRCDAYLSTHSAEVGIKRRNHGPLEVKLLTGRPGTIHLRNGLVGHVEEWRKITGTSPPLTSRIESWVDVHKNVLTRTFHPSATNRIVEIQPDQATTSGCDIELAEVTVDGLMAWTFAVEAWGPTTRRRALFDQAVVEFFASAGFPPLMTSAFDTDMGYPEWLINVSGDNDSAGFRT